MITKRKAELIREYADQGLSAEAIARMLSVHISEVKPLVAERGVNAIETWLREAQPGERLIYHSGNLSEDRRKDRRLAAMAKQVLDYAARGVAAIYQRRRGQAIDYIIEKRRQPLANHIRDLAPIMTRQDLGRCGQTLAR